MTRVRARLVGIERRFGSVTALAGASLELHEGEVHGVLGANGAGKSTLFNVLGGMVRPDAGTIEVGGSPVELASPRDAWSHGIVLVHQHFTLVPALTAIENLALGVRDRSISAVRREAEAIVERTDLRVPLDILVERLGVGDRQRLEILKALLRDPGVLVLDEPTAVLTPAEVEGLFSLLRGLAREGRAVALVAHKLDEVLGVSDRVTVLRAGRTVLSARPTEHDTGAFVEAMIGPEAAGAWARRSSGPAAVDDGAEGEVAVLDDVHVDGSSGPALRGVSLRVTGGSIVGIAGVDGNGQRELARVLAGRLQPTRGSVRIPPEVGFIPQDRTHEGLVADFDLVENAALAFHRTPEYVNGPWIRWDEVARAAEEVRERFDVAAPSTASLARELSGGNQQRVIVGRELMLGSPLLVAENPTRGLDVASALFVHDELRRLARSGVAIVLISTDLDEVLALATTVWAIRRGSLVPVPEGERTREGIGAHMLAGNAGRA